MVVPAEARRYPRCSPIRPHIYCLWVGLNWAACTKVVLSLFRSSLFTNWWSFRQDVLISNHYFTCYEMSFLDNTGKNWTCLSCTIWERSESVCAEYSLLKIGRGESLCSSSFKRARYLLSPSSLATIGFIVILSWYTRVAWKMTVTVTENQLSRCKRQYHPGKVSLQTGM